ncbi:hypothetical protein CRYUN_Cryun23aG0143600 [Craigia yunnanensis]
MPKCSHNLHLSCIDVWLRKQSTSPVCRLPFLDSSEAIHMRPATFKMTQSMDSPETSTDHSRQCVLPGPERSIGNQINQAYLDSATRNSEMNRGQAET